MQFYDTVAREVGERPEVKSVGWTSSLPYGTTSELGMWSIEVVGDPSVAPESRPTADFAVADEGYFRTLDLPIVAGRGFSDRDTADTAAGLHRQRSVRPAGPPGAEPDRDADRPAAGRRRRSR